MYYNNYKNKEIIKRICESAKKYKNNLLNKNIIFIFENKKKQKIEYIEVLFLAQNFLHFTGIKYEKSAGEFFKECLKNRISPNSIKIKDKGFTQLKLEILENAMSINKSAKRIGEYNGNKLNIKIEKVVGNTHFCLGLSKLDSNSNEMRYYYPKTLIQDDLKSNIIQDNRIVAILSKHKNYEMYNEITYFSKDINLRELFENKALRDIIDSKNIYSENLSYNQKIIDFLKCLE